MRQMQVPGAWYGVKIAGFGTSLISIRRLQDIEAVAFFQQRHPKDCQGTQRPPFFLLLFPCSLLCLWCFFVLQTSARAGTVCLLCSCASSLTWSALHEVPIFITNRCHSEASLTSCVTFTLQHTLGYRGCTFWRSLRRSARIAASGELRSGPHLHSLIYTPFFLGSHQLAASSWRDQRRLSQRGQVLGPFGFSFLCLPLCHT